MNLYQYIKRHLIVIICLVVIGYSIVALIHLVFPHRIEQSFVRGESIAFVPEYNKYGSMFHAKLKIGYRQGLLIAECVIMLPVMYLFYRLVEYYNIFFGLKRFWSYFIDFGCAVVVGRLPTHLLGIYTLDYLYIRATHSIYDFFDLCIGVFSIGMLGWLIPYNIRYHHYKKSHTRGMRLWQKIKWEFQFGIKSIRMSLSPIKTWWKDVV